MIKKILLTTSVIVAFIGCSSDSNTAGGAEDVNTFTIAGIVKSPNGIDVSEGCSVVLLPTNHVPDGTELDSAEFTNGNGAYRVKAEKGIDYNLWAIKDSLSFIVFNIASDSDQVDRNDTLKVAGSVKVTLPDNFSINSEAVVYIPGTGVIANIVPEDVDIDNGIARFVIPNIAPASYDEFVFDGNISGNATLNDESLYILSDSLIDDALYPEWSTIEPLSVELQGINITALGVSESDEIYVGTDSSGLSIQKGSIWEKASPVGTGLSMKKITSIKFCKDTAYIITDEGLVKAIGDSYENITINNSTVNSYEINDVAVMNDGVVYVSMSIGIACLKDGIWRHSTTTNEGINLGVVTSIDGVRTNALYAANDFGLLKLIDDSLSGKWEYVSSGDLQTNKIVVADSLNAWIATGKGLFSYDGSILSEYSVFGQISINALAVGKDNSVWSYNKIKNEIHGIRNNTSVYSEDNTPTLISIDEITAIASLNEKTTLFAAGSKGILVLSYKKMH